MSLRHARVLSTAIGLALMFSWPSADSAFAVSPGSVIQGRMLFEKQWTPQNPAIVGRDGLGPLFNGKSCVACHHQGGVGGGGAAEFNAKTLSIEEMQVVGKPMNRDVVRQAVSAFHPGFVDPTVGLMNSVPLSHHGGTSGFDAARRQIMSQLAGSFSDNGGSISAEEVRYTNASPIQFTHKHGNYQTTIRARMFQRNTTALFGAGLIDQVTSKQLRAIERAQKSHPEISGRVSTLPDGRMGRFGWRSNVPTLLDFCDKACAAELGLETRRMDQPIDPLTPGYRNPGHDLPDAQIRTMAEFIAALPAPIREMPTDSDQLRLAVRGEQVFTSVGCSVCHQQTVGPAVGIYSDLLLHDMGRKNYDLNPADPYIAKSRPITLTESTSATTETTESTIVGDTVMGRSYYGGRFTMEPGFSTSMSTVRDSSSNRGSVDFLKRTLTAGQLNGSLGVKTTPQSYHFVASRSFPTSVRIIDPSTETRQWEQRSDVTEQTVEHATGGRNRLRTASGNGTFQTNERSQSVTRNRRTTTRFVRLQLEGTAFTQEWRTPPLWGVRDSAPYMHDGRAETLLESITMHEGEAKGTRDRFLKLSLEDRQAVIVFLETMVAPPNAPQVNN